VGPRDCLDEVDVKGKGKAKLTLCCQHHAMEAYWGSGGIAPLNKNPFFAPARNQTPVVQTVQPIA